MHKNEKQLLGKWIVELVAAYFTEQKNNHGDKLFIKVVGVDDEAWGDVLQAFADAEERLTTFFRPVLRTLAPIPSFEKYQCQYHETSTWLRNNTSQGSALVILLNEASAEAQSLENIFTVDEARLLSSEGLEVLYQILSDEYQYFGEDLDQLKKFLVMYGKLVEPQLRTILSFLTAVIESGEKTMTDRIQQNLDQLEMFRDRKLKFTGDGWKQLKANYQLSRLEKDGRALDKEKTVDNVYTFLEKNESHELWENITKDDFRRHALDYIHGKTAFLLKCDFSMVREAFIFKDKKPTVNERINTFKEMLEIEKPLSQERNQLLTEATEAIHSGEKPEKLQEFLEDFGGQLLVSDKKLYKDIERLIKKLRQLSEYTELTDALLRETFDMLKQQRDESDVDLETVRFDLLILEAPIGKEMEVMLRFHLGALERLTGLICFDKRTLDRISDRTKDSFVGFRLVMWLDNVEVGYRDFKLIELSSSRLPDLLEKITEDRIIPTIRSYAGTDTVLVDVLSEMQDRVSAFIASGQPGVTEAVAEFTNFVDWYVTQIQQATVQGIGSLDLSELEKRLEELFIRGRESALIAKHVTQWIGTMGTIDHFSSKQSDKVGKIKSRVLTLINPLRLLGYANRLLRMNTEIHAWIRRLDETEDSLSDMDAILNQLQDDLSQLSPAYFAIDGMPDHFLIEQQEAMGEGIFIINGASNGEDQLVQTFADELLGTVKSYLEVYPYAKDCLDLVFLYCPQATFVTRAISQLFQQTAIRKIRAIIHSNKDGAIIHEQLNAWISQEEQLSERLGHFPRVEVQVIAEQDINAMMRQVAQQIKDADIGVLVNYFGQSSHLQYKLEKVTVEDSSNWFETIYREPLKKDDAVKRISCVSEILPPVVQLFYQVQQVLHFSESVQDDEHCLLRTIISVNQLSDQELLNYMHDYFNWSLFIDRYLDKSLLRYVSSKAQIIKYKSNAGQNKNYRTLLSSSKYIRKLANEQADHEYFDRLHQKYVQLLKNSNISKEAIALATEKVKEISGGVVLRAIGPGKFAHELMAIHLAIQARPVVDDELVVWSICDDLPWFNGSARRPDLVRTSIRLNGERIAISFEIIELKFISHTIFEQERYDAMKQVNAGLEVYRSRFMFAERPATAELWRKELMYNLLENGTYSFQHALLLKRMQVLPLSSIDVAISGSIDTFVYTSNLLELSIMESNENGYKQEVLGNSLVNNIYNRTYILRALGAFSETEVPNYDIGVQAVNAYITDKLGVETSEDASKKIDENKNNITVIDGGNSLLLKEDEQSRIAQEEISQSLGQVATTKLVPETEPIMFIEKSSQIMVENHYSERLAFSELPTLEVPPTEDLTPLLRSYESRLRHRMNEINVPLKIVETIVGASVIRIVVELIGNTSFSLIKNRSEDLQMWLGLNSPPQIAIRGGKVNIDINRDTPEVVYFERFMERVREQVNQGQLAGKLIAPLGVGQLGEVITMDFSSPDTPHLLIGGQSGSGKSVTINGIILALMCLYSPKDVQFLFIDPKRVEFMVYKDKIHTQQVITDIEEAIDALDEVVLEMEQRYERFAQEGATNYNEFLELGGEHIPRIVVVFDEFADFMTQDKPLSSRVETAIKRLGSMARAAGIHLLLCTQSPRADIVPTNIRNNLGARLALRTADTHASRIVLDDEGAERLGGKGDFLAKLNIPEFVRGKSPFLTARAKKALLDHFRNRKE